MATKKKTTKKTAKAKVPTKSQVTAPKKKAVKKTTAKKATAKKTAPRKAAPKKAAPKKVAAAPKPSPEDRYRMIEQAAYFLAEKHHFQADPAAIWVQAEKEVDAQLATLKR